MMLEVRLKVYLERCVTAKKDRMKKDITQKKIGGKKDMAQNEELRKKIEEQGRAKGKKYKNPNNIRSNLHGNENLQTGDNARYLRFALDSYNLPPLDIEDAEAVEERINWYFRHCIECDIKPGVAGLCGALGIHRNTFYQWSVGNQRGSTHQDLSKKAYQVLEQLMEQYVMNGKINPVSGIFLMKNHFGYTDKQEVVVAPKNGIGEVADQKQLEQRYIEDVVEVQGDTKKA